MNTNVQSTRTSVRILYSMFETPAAYCHSFFKMILTRVAIKQCHIFMALKLRPLTLCPVFMTPWNVSPKHRRAPLLPSLSPPNSREWPLDKVLAAISGNCNSVVHSLLVFYALCNPQWVFIQNIHMCASLPCTCWMVYKNHDIPKLKISVFCSCSMSINALCAFCLLIWCWKGRRLKQRPPMPSLRPSRSRNHRCQQLLKGYRTDPKEVK